MREIQDKYFDGAKPRDIIFKGDNMRRKVWKLNARPNGINFEEALELVDE